ncbi:MAG: fasciclin domain-containing protein [Polyangiaceae bacterium]|nr:fasciclin domain-containing protein [Polyangiaceae bacterium]
MKNASRFATAFVIALGVGVAGCGSDDDSSEPSTQQQQQKSIIETAQAAGSFTTLVAAVEAAGLVDTLSGPGPFTVFAPTDAAFAKLPAGTVDTLLKPENKQALADILTYHVVSGDVRAETVITLNSATTVNGASVTIKVMDGSVILNDTVKVVQTDIVATNGVIHVLDAVLLPPEG